MFLWDWFTGLLSYLGLYKKYGKILILGLDCSGKTTLLHMMRDSRISLHPPTIRPTCEQITVGDLSFIAYDLCGHRVARSLWKDFDGIDGIVYLIDAADRERFSESKEELMSLLSVDQISNVPVLILGNKIDKPVAVSEEELKQLFNLTDLCTGKGVIARDQLSTSTTRPLELFMCSVIKLQRYGEGFEWLSQYIK